MATEVADALQRYIRDRQEKGTDWHYWVVAALGMTIDSSAG